MISRTEWFHDISELATASANPASRTLEDPINTIVDEHYEPLLRYLTLLSWNRALSEEIAQETFLRLHRELLQGAKVGRIKGWLFRVAHNLAIDQSRRLRAEDSLSDEDVSRRVENLCGLGNPNPEALLLERERMRRLQEAIGRLPLAQRHALYLRREGFRYHEIAGILGMGETTVVDHVRRAVERLNQELHDAHCL